jgi:predicted amidohydrolase/ribosomal protein S18 acetylase RimI-like enzyme
MTDAKSELPIEHRLHLRNLRLDDYDDVRHVTDLIYPNMPPWTREQFSSQVTRFPEGQICIEDNGKVVGAAMSLIVNYARYGDRHTYEQITGNGYITTHDPDGDTLYGMELFVHPDYRNLRLGRRLYDARKELCDKLNLRALVVGGRIPNYWKHADQLSPQQYVELVRAKELLDPILTFQLANDFHVRRILTGYMPDDAESHAYAVLLEWINIYYEEKQSLIGGRKPEVRIGAVQWQMRSLGSLQELLQQIEFFVDAVAGYKADIILFPEFFNAPLMARFNQGNPAEAVRRLAEYTEPLRQEMVRLALAYNINIIAGSMPEYLNNTLYNVSYVCRRDGRWDKQYKLHVTPDEDAYWGMKGGHELKVFDLDIGKVGVLICYDVEFPELPRLLAEQGMQLLFVPFLTDTKNGYLRVRRCAQARAIENECYVVIAGNVGNLPNVENMDIQYSQAAVFTPSDFAFPHDAIAAEATPNTEMTLIVDLDLDNLKEMRVHGSVRNFRDRRLDLYRVTWVGR